MLLPCFYHVLPCFSSLKDNEEASKVAEIQPAVASADVEPLDESIYTEAVVLPKGAFLASRSWGLPPGLTV